jgi:hypothetical protein
MTISATRQLVLPIEHLEAELLAAPFASTAAFKSALLSLDPCLRRHTERLWRDQELEILQRFPGMSIDELTIRRDRIWFLDTSVPANEPRNLIDLLRTGTRVMARAYSPFPSDDLARSATHLQTQREDVDARRRWRWTTFSLPVDLLMASVGHPREAADVTCFSLRAVLADRGLAESHLHLKASLEFPLLWASLQRALSHPDAREKMLAGPAAQFDEGRNLAPWLIRAALARLALGAFLTTPSRHARGFGAFVRDHAIPRITRLQGPVLASMVHRALRELAAGGFSAQAPPFSALRAAYAALIGPAAADRGASLDPVAYWFASDRQSQPEFHMLRAAFSFLESPRGSDDKAFARLFWQTVRMRVIFYRHIVQRPMIPGLQWFTRTYDRLSNPRRPIRLATFIERAVALSGEGLKSLEVRLAPDARLSDIQNDIIAIDKVAREHSDIDIGVVYHFIRSRGPDAQRGVPHPWGRASHDDPQCKLNPAGIRFSGYYLARRAEAAALANLLTTYPRMLERVRGIDLCTDELGIPLWVMLPLVRHVRRAGAIAARALSGTRHPVQPLRTTVHAGEDFVHLLGSIRRMGEALEFLDLREGDRIGHGVALGFNVAHWAARAAGLSIPRGERLFDLMWAWHTITRSPNEALRPWLPWITQQAIRVGREIFDEDVSINVLSGFVLNLYSTSGLMDAGFPCGKPPDRQRNPAEQLTLAWLRDRRVFQRSHALEPIDLGHEASLVQALQNHVRTLFARIGIVVEINPSSNLLIGHLGDLTDHPLWRLCPPGQDHNGSTHVRVCIGSDDPITFATRLPEEYQLLADAMIEGGLSMTQIDTWLDRARAAGMSARFTVRRSPISALTKPHCLERLSLEL